MELDERLTDDLRVRRWIHGSAPLPDWPAGAHDEVELAWVDTGGLIYTIGEKMVEVTPGHAVLIPVEVEHHTRVAPNTKAGSVHLSLDTVEEISDAIGASIALEARRLSNQRIVQLGHLLLAEAKTKDKGRTLAADALGEVLTVEVLRALDKKVSKPAFDPRIARAIEQITTCYTEPLSVEVLAQTAGMSRYHFSRVFREQVGKSPYQYLLEVRVERATHLLHEGRSVTDTAFSVGFEDLGRFSRAFKKVVGCSPSAFGTRAA